MPLTFNKNKFIMDITSKEKWTQAWEKIKKFFGHATKAAIVVVAFSIGFTARGYYTNYQDKISASEVQKVKTIKDVKVWLNPQSELMISSISSGTPLLIVDSIVGDNISALWANNHYKTK
jgi:hypothetical protein